MQVDAFLCDAATVREGLLHILGGGITRLWREQFPAQIAATLAVMIVLHPTEAESEHKMVIRVASEDGQDIATMEGSFRAQRGDLSKPGELIASPLVLNLHSVPLPRAGSYSVDILIDNQHQRSLQFVAAPSSEKSSPQ